MSLYGITRAPFLPLSVREGLPPPIEPAPQQRCFPWDTPDIGDLPLDLSRGRLSLTADISESASSVARCLERLGVQVFRRPITADYAVGSLGIVRRTGSEITRLACGGTLAAETMMLARAFRHRLLICEDLQGAPHVSRRLWGTLVRAGVEAGIPALLTSDPMDTARLIAWVASVVAPRQQRKPYMFLRGQTTFNNTAGQIRLLAAFPNVGKDLACRLLERYGSVRGTSARRQAG